MAKAVYPGSFDPIHSGHVDIIERLARVYDEVVVLISESTQKTQLFTEQERKKLIEATLKHLKNVTFDIHSGLTVDYMKQNKTQIMVRGLRAVVDFEYEMTMASMNKKLSPKIETLLMFARPDLYYISSRGVKEIAKHGGTLEGIVPKPVAAALVKKLRG
jgi:pantetheine-phosphate adenylyltransferase